MTTRVRAVSMLMAALAMMGLASCDHYNCTSGATFGSSSCSTTTTTTGGAAAFAFAVDPSGPIDGFTLNTTAASFGASPNYTAPTVTANLGGVGMVVAQKKFLYAVFADLGQIYGWTIDSTGNLTTLGSPTAISLTGVSSTSAYNQSVVITNPAGTLLFISDAGDEQIYVYQISSTGTLTAALGSPFSTPGIEPQNLAMDGLGNYLYASEDNGLTNHQSSGVAAYSVSNTGSNIGAITLIANYPSYPMWEMQGEPTGKYLIGISGKTTYYSGSEDDSIYVFSIAAGTGTLSQVTNSPFATTNAPFNIAAQPAAASGALIYSFSIKSDNSGPNPVEGYQLDPSTGALTAVSGSLTGIAAPWGQFDQSGSYLILYVNQALSAYQVSSSGGLTAIGSAAPLPAAAYWAITDVP